MLLHLLRNLSAKCRQIAPRRGQAAGRGLGVSLYQQPKPNMRHSMAHRELPLTLKWHMMAPPVKISSLEDGFILPRQGLRRQM